MPFIEEAVANVLIQGGCRWRRESNRSWFAR
jgi:hypothetical protein